MRIETRSYSIRVGPQSSGRVLARRGEDPPKHRTEGDVQREAEPEPRTCKPGKWTTARSH